MNSEKVTRRIMVAGTSFGMLTILESPARMADKVLCRCACGVEKRINAGNIASGKSRSCGCRVAERARERMRTHGMKESPEYVAWCNAKARCHRKTHPRYAEWGGRGISMCDRWRESFESFLADMGPRPSPGHSIDRIDGSRWYEPGNCRWATAKVQSTNRPSWTNTITFDGRTQTITEWAAEVGIARKSLYDRLAIGWTVERAMTAPKGSRKAASK